VASQKAAKKACGAAGADEPPAAPGLSAPRAAAAPKAPPATSEATRRSMQGNRSKDTRPELVVRTYLRDAGLTGYRLQWKRAAGRPDVAFPGRRVAIFVHGCFWHRCPYCSPSRPRTNVEFWEAKFRRNRERDERDARELLASGWTVIVVWECRLKKKRVRRTMDEVVAQVRRAPAVRVKADERPGRLVVLGRTYVRGPRGLAAVRVRARGHRPARARA
jgi:DNA mismatch endonuclease (patch repair protein)